MIGTLKDYTESLKQHIPEGQKISLWEQFLTGTSQQYQTLTQQAQDVYAYDISQAYANYKQQQLQLQMNQQLGEGFKQQVGSQLQSQYSSAFSDIKTQEATALGKIGEQYTADVLEGQKQFEQLGKQAQTLDKLFQEYANAGQSSIKPTGDVYLTETDEFGRETRTLTDAGRLWYYDVFNRPDLNFQDWLLSENSLSTIDLEDRQAIADALSGENRQLLLETVAGIGKWNKNIAEETRTRLSHNMDEKRQNIKHYAGSAEGYDMHARKQEFTNVETGEKYTSQIDLDSTLSKQIIKNTPNLEKDLKSKKLETGDIIELDGKKYVIGHWQVADGELQVEFYRNASVKDDLIESTPLDYDGLTQKQQTSLLNNKKRNPDLVSKHTHSSYNYNNKKGELLTDDYGHTWYIKKQDAIEARDMSEDVLKQYSRGDIIYINNKYYVVDTSSPSSGRLLLKELENRKS